MKKQIILSITLATLFALRPAANAAAITASFNNYAPSLSGTTRDLQWGPFTDETKPAGVSSSTSGAASQWSAGLAPANNPSAAARFAGTAGFGTDTTDFQAAASGGGIYGFFSQTHYSITNTDPILNLKSMTLQIYLAEGTSSMFGGSSTAFAAAPTLTLQTTNGVQTATQFSLLYSQISIPGNGPQPPTNIDLQTFQWDLSAVTGTITSYSINWQDSYHTIIYGMDVTESNAIQTQNILAVPEPSTYAYTFAGFGLFAVMARRRVRCAVRN